MSEPKPARPPQVTLAGWLVMAGSVLVVLTAFSEVASLRSLDTRESVERRVAERGGDFFGLDVQGVLTAMRILLMVAAASATATAILGWQVLRRSKGARIALSVLAGPLFVAGLVQQGGFASAMVTAAILMLWFQPARDWFDGITREAPARPVPPRSMPPVAPPVPPPVPPPVTPPVGPSERDPLLDLPPPTAPPLHPTPYAAGADVHAAGLAARPPSVVWACVLTWLLSVPALVLFGSALVAMVADPQQLVDEVTRQSPETADQLTDATIRNVLYVTASAVIVWAVAAVVLAILVWRRVAWAASLLLVATGVAGVLCLLAVVGSLLVLVPLAACSVTFALLLRPESRAWLRAGPPP